ncbi:DUF6266 family protein [Flavobacterium sp. SM2513]|uniref:DUF6266 family protein n=1 Tax=Flavobacterium sp. SM2513 TaxID=3424766 RepID=UPI003D7F884B
MAIYTNGILGTFSGKVGPVVGVNYKGTSVMRAAPKKSTKPATPLQLIQQAKMSSVMQLLSPIKELLALYFGTSVDTRSRNNLAVSYFLTEVIKYEAENFVILYEKMMFAQGVLLFLANLECEKNTDNTLQFTWNNNSNQGGTKPTDELIIVVFNSEKEEYVYYSPAGTRADETAIVALPDNYVGDEVYVYAFMAAVNRKSNSSSWCCGKFLVG